MRKDLLKFLLLLAVLVGYFVYLSLQYDPATGVIVAALTWSFFVLCTPVADAGFLLDFPVRLITNIRMIHTEIMVWIIAISVNIFALAFSSESYETTFLTSLFHKILITPWPYWIIIFLCGAGTFLSIHFGDEVMDAVSQKIAKKHHKHKSKLKFALIAIFYLAILFAYYHLLESLDIHLPD